MNTAKHTPGPWIADRNGLGELAIFTAKGKHTLSCEGDKPLPLRQREANAELQAAAPTMYEALQAIVQACASRTYKEVLHTAEGKKLFLAYEQSCKALAQAEGK